MKPDSGKQELELRAVASGAPAPDHCRGVPVIFSDMEQRGGGNKGHKPLGFISHPQSTNADVACWPFCPALAGLIFTALGAGKSQDGGVNDRVEVRPQLNLQHLGKQPPDVPQEQGYRFASSLGLDAFSRPENIQALESNGPGFEP